MSRVRRFIRIAIAPVIIGAALLLGGSLSAGDGQVQPDPTSATVVTFADSSWT